jgi:regulator of RNase E activity RraA
VDIFLEALETAQPGDVLVIDNRGRTDEACIGDLVALEAKHAGLAAMVVWGLHRDTPEISEIGVPVFSLGAIPTGPLHLEQRDDDALKSASIGPWIVTSADFVLGDENGVLFIPLAQAETIARVAQAIRKTEHDQAAKMKQGITLRTQLRFSDYLSRRAVTPSLNFRQHLRTIGGAVEE